MKHGILCLAVIVFSGVLMIPSAQAQMAMVPMKRIVRPDTPPNRRLLKAVEEGNLADVQTALRDGASADMQTGWEGPSELISVALLVGQPTSASLLSGQTQADRRKHSLPIFRLLIQNVSASSAANPKIGPSLLGKAVEMEDFDSLQRLVAEGADVNARLYAGVCLLESAIQQNGTNSKALSPIIKFLLDHGAQVNVQDAQGMTPLMAAAGLDKADVVKVLLARGADPAVRDKQGLSALNWAALRGWEDVISLLRDRSPMDIYEAAQFGDVPRLRAYLDAGKDPNAPNTRGTTPLMAAGTTPLMAAMKSGSIETAQLLLDHGANVNGTRGNGTTALHLAARYGDTALVGFLLDHGANINAAMTGRSDPATPLTSAVWQAQADVVALLLKRGADLKHGQGEAALDIATRELGNGFLRPPPGISQRRVLRGNAVNDARWHIIELLLSAGVDLQAKDSHALYLAARNGQAGLIEFFLSKGADVNGRGAVGPVGSLSDGQTALMGAIEAWSSAYFDETMLKDGTMLGPDIKDVHEAERFAQKSVSLLLAHGANVNLPDARGTTPLMQCVSDGLPTLAALLLARGAKVDATDPAGQTALMRAATDDNHALAALLLAHHANVNVRDKQRQTALSLARNNGVGLVVKLLTQAGARH